MTRDSAFEERLGQILSVGSLISSLLLAAGLVLLFVGHRVAGAADLALHTGLIVLMATPVMRVLASVVEYTRRRDWMFVGVTLIVLLELAVSVIEALRA